MNNVWATEDLNTLRTQLMLRRDLHAVAATLERPVSEVEEMARDLGLMMSPPLASEESKGR